jgi:hypothetical protein
VGRRKPTKFVHYNFAKLFPTNFNFRGANLWAGTNEALNIYIYAFQEKITSKGKGFVVKGRNFGGQNKFLAGREGKTQAAFSKWLISHLHLHARSICSKSKFRQKT